MCKFTVHSIIIPPLEQDLVTRCASARLTPLKLDKMDCQSERLHITNTTVGIPTVYNSVIIAYKQNLHPTVKRIDEAMTR